MDALIQELFEARGLASQVFKACMTLQDKDIKAKAQSEIILKHALLNDHPHALVVQLNSKALHAFHVATQSPNRSERPPKKATALGWFFQTQLRRLWSRHYAKQSSEKNLAEQLILRNMKIKEKCDSNVTTATDMYARRLVSAATKLQEPPDTLEEDLRTFALCQRSSRLQKLVASSPAPLFPDEGTDHFDWFNAVFEFDALDGPGDSGGVVSGEAELPHSLSNRNVGFVSGNSNAGFQLPDLNF